MRVKIEDIREDGLELREPIGMELLTEALSGEGAADTGFRPKQPSRLNAKLSRVSGGVLLKAAFEVMVTAPCKRCLVDVTATVPVAFTLDLVPEKLTRAASAEGEDEPETPRAGSFQLNDVDEEVFDGKVIELDPIVREQLLLALPMDVVCAETCQGLCSMCGQNLNEKKCVCEQKVVDPRLAALKNIKLN